MMSLPVSIIVTLLLGVLGISSIRSWLKKHYPWITELRLDLAIVVFLLASIAVSSVSSLQNTQQQRAMEDRLAAIKEKDSLRQWAMVLPTGEMTFDGLHPIFASVGYTELHQKVFRKNGSQIEWGGTSQCASPQYISDIRKLIDVYPQLAYGDAALALCLKVQGQTEWQDVAKKAQAKLRKLVSVQPRTVLIDGFYTLVSSWLGFTPEQLGFVWKINKNGENYLESLNLPE